MDQGLLVIISAPSGGGKGAVINGLLKIIPRSAQLITATTRPLRPRDRQGVDHNFISREEFEKKIKNHEILEYNYYADNYYGTEKAAYEKMINEFPVVFMDIDINGKKALDRLNIPHLSIFLVPDDMKNLEARIIQRGGTPADKIKKRLETAKKEIQQAEIYDHRVINYEGKLGQTIARVAEIIRAKLMT